MKLELIDSIHSLPDNQASELKYYLSKRVGGYYNRPEQLEEEKQLIEYGFMCMLDMIQQDSTLIQPTLYGTMIKAKRELNDLSKWTKQYKQISAVTLAMAHMRYCMVIDNEMQREAQYEAEYDKATKTRNYPKTLGTPIWALKVDDDNAEPFIAGYSYREAGERLRIKSYGNIAQIIANKRKTRSGYKLWRNVEPVCQN